MTTNTMRALQVHAWPGLLEGSDGIRMAVTHGRLTVPARHGDPTRGTIELRYARIPSRSDRPGPPIVLLAGGPGASGIDATRTRWAGPSKLLDVADLIVLDQRGVGQSTPCLDSPLRLDLPLDRPLERGEALARSRERARAVAGFWRERGVEVSAYTTEESADDVALLAETLGGQIDLVGQSYGSHLGLSVLRRHPDRVRRAVLGLVEGPDHTFKLPSTLQRHLAGLGERARSALELGGAVPDLCGLLAHVLDGLDQTPAAVTTPEGRVVIGRFDAQLLLAQHLGAARRSARLPAELLDLQAGDLTVLAARAVAYRTGWLPSAMSLVMDCASGASPERRARIAAEAPETLLGDLIDFPVPEVGDAWGAPDLGEGFRAPLVSDVPTLLISGALDARTPVANAVEVLAGLRRGSHLVVEGMGHDPFLEVPEVGAAACGFLREGGTAVTSAIVPFAFTPRFTEGRNIP